jgi:O-antigen/teichoic acid export membrane protein
MTTDLGPTTASASAASGIADDARSLKRALGLQVIGYVLKAGLPVLLAFATQAYGVSRWGVFVALQALVLMAQRVAIFGLDKAILWWVGAHDDREVPRALGSSLGFVAITSLSVGALLALAGQFVLARWQGAGVEQLPSLVLMLAALPLMTTTDVLLHASMGERKMGAQIAVRDTLQPSSWLVLAIVLHLLGLQESGLAIAFLTSQAFAFIAAIYITRAWSRVQLGIRPPSGLLRYAVAVWLNEISNTTLQRVDALVLAGLTDPFTVGIWGVVAQFANAMRMIRRAFDPILVAVTARISRAHDSNRLAQALSYATQLVSMTQLPVFVFLLLFAGSILPLYGHGFEQGSTALVVVCAFWLVNGAISLSGVVLAGYGYARLGLIITLLGIAFEVPLMLLLVPRYGLVGAALAVGTANLLQQFVQLWQMKRLTGSLHYNERARRPTGPAVIAGGATALTWIALHENGAAQLTSSIGAFAVFAVTYGICVGVQWRRGLLRAPGHEEGAALDHAGHEAAPPANREPAPPAA